MEDNNQNNGLSVVTDRRLEQALSELWQAAKVYVDSQIDTYRRKISLLDIYKTPAAEDEGLDFYDNYATALPSINIFANMQNVRSITLNALTTVSQGTNDKENWFCSQCPLLQSVSLPFLTSIYWNQNNANYAFSKNPNLREINLPSLRIINCNSSNYGSNYAFSENPSLREITLPSLYLLQSARCCLFSKCSNLQRVCLPEITGYYSWGNSADLFQDCPDLIDIEIGHTTGNLNVGSLNSNIIFLKAWNPYNVLADTEKTATLNANIRNHIAANLFDRTGTTALTITFSAAVFAALEEETKAAFAAKNWTIASA